MAKQNELNENAIWPESPNGVLDRVRIDRLIVVPDNQLPISGGIPSNNPDSSDKTIDLQWGFGPDPPETFYMNHTLVSLDNPFYIQQALIHELGHARYLIDNYALDVHNLARSGGHDAVQIYEGGVYVGGSGYMPYITFDVLYYNQNGGVMTGPYGFAWSPHEAAALNRIAGERARCGNMNSPCNIGEYLQDLPTNNHLRILDTNGYPRRGVDVHVYQAVPHASFYGKTFDNTPDQLYTTDASGYVHLPRNPFNPGGALDDSGVTSVIILRIQQGTQVWYRFLEAPDFNLEYWRGHTQDGYYALALAGPNDDNDNDGIPVFADNCTVITNPTQCDSDADGYGNRCDGDLNNNGATNAQDVAMFRQQLGLPSTPPTYNQADINCNGAVNAQDVAMFRQLLGSPPGPSGLACAGTVPCPVP